MSATRRSKQSSTRFFTCSGSRVSDSDGEADEVGEQDRDDAALVGPAAAAGGRRTGRIVLPRRSGAPHAGHITDRVYGRGSDSDPFS